MYFYPVLSTTVGSFWGAFFLSSLLSRETGKIPDETWEVDDEIKKNADKLAAIYGQKSSDEVEEEEEEDEVLRTPARKHSVAVAGHERGRDSLSSTMRRWVYCPRSQATADG